MSTPGANAPNQRPAFTGQTRVPEVKSNYSLQRQVVSSALSSPWGMEFLPDGRVLVTQKGGAMVIVNQQGSVSRALTGVPSVTSSGQGGLLDVALSPNFVLDRMVYFSYAEPRGNNTSGTAVAKGRLADNDSGLTNVQVIFRQTPAWNSSLHFGSRLVFDGSGNLFVTLGERSNPDARVFAQDINTHLGKVVRIKTDGTAPAGNPFVGRANSKAEVWSYGHRNPQSAAIDPATGALWTVEHGPRGGDELNRPQPGKNYGWPVITYGIDYNGSPIGDGITSKDGMEQPVYYWDPVIAPAGMLFYEGDMFPAWKGNLLIGSLNPGGLVRLILRDDRVRGEERLVTNAGRVRDVAEADDGSIWYVTDSGQLVRLFR